MPAVSEKLVLELQALIKEHYGKDLTRTEAFESTSNLVGFFDLLVKMDHEEKTEPKPQHE